jgi:hypothetical protein
MSGRLLEQASRQALEIVESATGGCYDNAIEREVRP